MMNQDDRSPGSGTTRRSGSSNEQHRSHSSDGQRHSNTAATTSRSEDTSFTSFLSDMTPSGALASGPRTSRNNGMNLHDGVDRPSVPRHSEDAGARPSPPLFEEVASNLQNDANNHPTFASVASDTTPSAARMSDNATSTGHAGGGVAAAAYSGMASALASAAGNDIENESPLSHFLPRPVSLLARRLQHQDKFTRDRIDGVDEEEEAASNPTQETVLDSSSPGTQVQTVSPGAFAVAGPGGSSAAATSQDDFSFSLQHHGENMPDTSDPIITAELVENDDQRSVFRREFINEMQHAELAPVVMDPPNEGNPAQSRKCQVFLVVFVSLAAVVAVVLGITLTQNNNGPDATPPPTPEPAISQQELKELIASVSFDGGAALEDSSSPQHQALMWLYNDTLREDYPDWRKIQRYALATLRYSANGTAPDTDTLWLTKFNECTWYSRCSPLTCNDGQNISCLDFSFEGLMGSIPPELALLSNSLDYLDLGSNNIGGSIPSELGLLSNLEAMGLYSNDITGRIPTEVGLLSKMIYLSLGDNALTGVIPTIFNSMTNLDGLGLYGNNFTGEFKCPDFIEECYISCWDYNDHNATSPCRSL